MPAKTIHPIGDQSGGVNTFANARDIDDRQYALGYNVDSSIPGEIRCVGSWNYYFYDSATSGFSNIVFAGSGTNDMVLVSSFNAYTGPIGDTEYEIVVETSTSVGSPDVIKWRKQLNDGGFGGYTTGINMTDDANPPVLDNGIRVYWTTTNTGHTVNDKWTFTASVEIFEDVKPGYGLFPFQADFNHASPAVSTEGYYLAVAKTIANATTDLKISMYHQPQLSSEYVTADVITIPYATEDLSSGATADFIWVDGALRVFDASLTGDDHNFFPYKWRLQESGNTYFKGAGDDDTSAITVNDWQTTRQQLISPTAGIAIHSTVSNFFGFPTDLYDDKEELVTGHGFDWADGNIANADSRVTLIIATDDSNNGLTTHDDEVGWGRDSTTSAEYYFYYSYLYENSQESLTFKYPQKITLGGAANTKYATFIPIVNPGGGASNTGENFSWDKRITGIRVYYRRADEEGDVKYFIGEFPVTSLTSDGDDTASYLGTNATSFLPALLGDESGSPEHNVVAYKNIGILHPTPPTIFTHATMSGIRDSSVTIACKYKTATIVNRRLYVGNIKQKTAESDGIEKKYPDRIIKSLPNKFDTLPDTEFIDVAIRDGEEIIKLESMGSRLLQFKQNTLYTIAVAGGEEYLEGTYKNMGVLHQHAVTKTEFGVFWVNDKGAYLYTGDKAPINLINGKIALKEWRDWITKDAITGYIPKEKKFIVINDAANVWATSSQTEGIDMFIYNALTQSWNHCVNVAGTGGGLDAVSNIVNYTDSEKEVNTLLLVGTDSLYEYQSVDDIDNNSRAIRPFKLITKDIHAGAPHVRKKFYKAYITYKGFGVGGSQPSNTSFPTVTAIIKGANGYSSVNLVGSPGFDVGTVSDYWRTAEYKIDSTDDDDKTASRNVYSIQLVIYGLTVYQNFKINDISLVFRPKSVK